MSALAGPVGQVILVGSDGQGPDWVGPVVIGAMVLSPCIVGYGWRLADWLRARRRARHEQLT